MYEGERPLTTGNRLLGHFFLGGIQRAKRGEPQVEITFEVDANGILHVSARDTVTNVSAAITIQQATGHRSKEEIEVMVAEAERLARDDAAALARVEARNELQHLCYIAKEVVTQSLMPKLELSEAVDKVEAWLEETEADRTTAVAAYAVHKTTLEQAMARA